MEDKLAIYPQASTVEGAAYPNKRIGIDWSRAFFFYYINY